MSHRLVLLLIFVSTLAAQMELGAAVAQESTPTSTPSPDREILLQATIAELPGSAVTLEIIRIILEPGAASPPHSHPGPEFGVMEEGTLTVRVDEPVTLLPAGSESAETSTVTPVGEEFSITSGDRIAYPAQTTLTFRNAGNEPVSLLAVTILPAGDDAPAGVTWAEGTPAPSDSVGITSESLGRVVIPELPTAPVAVTLECFTLSAGDVVTAYPGSALVSIEEGTLTGSVIEGAVEFAQSGAASNQASATPGATFVAAAGEALYFPQGMSETPPLRGDGSLEFLRLGILDIPDDTATSEPAADSDPQVDDPSGIQPGSTVIVTTTNVNLRAGPSTDTDVITVLQQGQVLVVTGPAETGGGLLWWPVSDPANSNVTGYVSADFLATVDE